MSNQAADSADRKPLVEAYHDWVAATVSPEGFDIPHALALNRAGEMTVYALALEVEAAYGLMWSTWQRGEAAELIFAFDRFTRVGQGTTLGDLLAGWHWSEAGPRPFIIEYQHEPRIVHPINWANPFWNKALTRELVGTVGSVLAMRRETVPNSGGVDDVSGIANG